MHGALRITLCVALAGAILSSGGCATKISPKEFINLYQTNISVPNPDSHKLPCRIFLGQRRGFYYIKDKIPRGQGGGIFGTGAAFRCRVDQFPDDFPDAYQPGDCVIDGRKGARYRYLIQSWRPVAAPAGGPATRPVTEK